MIRWAVITAAVSGALAIALGAFGAHALAATLAPRELAIYRTAADYHLLHSVALLAAGLAPAAGLQRVSCEVACALWLCGLVVFSGSLYLLAAAGLSALGAVTPLGGLGLLAGWLALGVGAWRSGGRA